MDEMETMAKGEVPPEESSEGSAGDAAKFITNLSSGLTTISQMIASMPDVDPADIQEIEDITDRFQGLMSKLAGAEAGTPPAAQSPKASRGKTVPVQSMAGKPVSPAGY